MYLTEKFSLFCAHVDLEAAIQSASELEEHQAIPNGQNLFEADGDDDDLAMENMPDCY